MYGFKQMLTIFTTVKAASTTGSPTITTDGSDTVYQFNGTGSITF